MKKLLIFSFLCLFVSCQSKKHTISESYIETDSESVLEHSKEEEVSEHKETAKSENTTDEKDEWTYIVEYSKPDEQGKQHVIRETFKGSNEKRQTTSVSNEKEKKELVSDEKSKNTVKSTTKKNEKKTSHSEKNSSLINTSWVFDVFLSILCLIGVLAVLAYLKQKISLFTKD